MDGELDVEGAGDMEGRPSDVVGEIVGDIVGENVGSCVGSCVGSLVGSCVGSRVLPCVCCVVEYNDGGNEREK